MQTLKFLLTPQNRDIKCSTNEIPWVDMVKAFKDMPIEIGTIIFDKRDLKLNEYMLKNISPNTERAVGSLVYLNPNEEGIEIGIEPFDNTYGNNLVNVFNKMNNDDERASLIAFGWITKCDFKGTFKQIQMVKGPYINYGLFMPGEVYDQYFDISDFEFRMFDTLVRHIEENEPSNWKVVDETCIDYQDNDSKLSILSSKDSLQVLLMSGPNAGGRFHLDTWNDVLDYITVAYFDDSRNIVKNLFIDILLSRGIKNANA